MEISMCRVQKVWCSSSPHDKIWGVCWPQIYSCGAPECRPRQCEHSETHSASHWLDHIRSIFIFFQFTTVRFKGQSKGKCLSGTMTRRAWNPLVAEEWWKPVGKLALRRKGYGEMWWLFSDIDLAVIQECSFGFIWSKQNCWRISSLKI